MYSVVMYLSKDFLYVFYVKMFVCVHLSGGVCVRVANEVVKLGRESRIGNSSHHRHHLYSTLGAS